MREGGGDLRLARPCLYDVYEGGDAGVEPHVHVQSVTKIQWGRRRGGVVRKYTRCGCKEEKGGCLVCVRVCAHARAASQFKQVRLDYIVGFVQHNVTLVLPAAQVNDGHSGVDDPAQQSVTKCGRCCITQQSVTKSGWCCITQQSVTKCGCCCITQQSVRTTPTRARARASRTARALHRPSASSAVPCARV